MEDKETRLVKAISASLMTFVLAPGEERDEIIKESVKNITLILIMQYDCIKGVRQQELYDAVEANDFRKARDIWF